MIKKPENARFADMTLAMLMYGLPGVGKSTLALSAPRPFYLDVDLGARRVKREHLKDYDDPQSYDEALNTIATLSPSQYDSIILDTVGALIETQKVWAGEKDPKNALKAGGGFALAGYGIVKSEYIRLFNELRRRGFKYIIMVFHAVKEKNGDQIYYDLVCEGAAKVFSWQPADLGCYMYIERGKRFLGFTPTIEYSAKSGHGISGIIEIPEVAPGQPNDFLTRLFAQVRTNMIADDEAGAADREKYAKIMEGGREIIASIKAAEDVMTAGVKLKALGEAMTSTAELRGLMNARLKELGITYNKEEKRYVQAAPPEPPKPEEPKPETEDGGGLL